MIVVCQNPVKETLTPSPNGVIQKFYTSQVYRAGTVSAWINGIKLIAGWEDGFTETGVKEVTLKETPLTGDSIQAEYEPA